MRSRRWDDAAKPPTQVNAQENQHTTADHRKNALALRYLHTPAAGKDAPGSRRGVSAESPNPRLV